MAVALTQERYDYFLYTVFLDYPEEDHGLCPWNMEAGVEQLQGSGNDAMVRSRLELLISKLIQTPEFQLY